MYMKTILLSLFLVVAAVSFAQKRRAGYVSVSNTEFGYRMEILSGMSGHYLNTEEKVLRAMVYMDTLDPDEELYVIVNRRPLSAVRDTLDKYALAGATLPERYAHFLQEINTFEYSYMTSVRELTISGKPGATYRYHHDIESNAYGQVAVVESGDYMYSICVSIAPKGRRKLKPVFDRIVRTFELTD